MDYRDYYNHSGQRTRARVNECSRCWMLPDEGVYMDDRFYCLECAREYIIDHWTTEQLLDRLDTVLDWDATEADVNAYVMTMRLDDIEYHFLAEKWEY